jgi:hypothetical protein
MFNTVKGFLDFELIYVCTRSLHLFVVLLCTHRNLVERESHARYEA